MKTPGEIVGFVDDLQRHMLRRPAMYASSPESLEEQLQLLESLRAFILGKDSEYREHLGRAGKSGAMSFTGKRRNDIWEEFCTFFKRYLDSQGRTKDKKKDDPR